MYLCCKCLNTVVYFYVFVWCFDPLYIVQCVGIIKYLFVCLFVVLLCGRVVLDAGHTATLLVMQCESRENKKNCQLKILFKHCWLKFSDLYTNEQTNALLSIKTPTMSSIINNNHSIQLIHIIFFSLDRTIQTKF